MIQDLSNSAYKSFKWCVGENNLTAIQNVINDNYYYNETDATPLTKVKQMGTEALHAVGKWTVALTLADKAISELTTWEPGFSEKLPIRITILNPSTILNHTVTVLGLLSLSYTIPVCFKNLNEAQKSFWKIIQVDYDNNFIVSFNDLAATVSNASTIFPVSYAIWHYGSYGAIAAVSATYLTKHYESTNTGIAKVAKLAIVAWTASQTPMVGPAIHTATAIANWFTGFIS